MASPFTVWKSKFNEVRHDIGTNSEAFKLGTALVRTSGLLATATINTSIDIVGVCAFDVTGDATTRNVGYYPTDADTQFLVQTKTTTPVQATHVGTVIDLGTVTNAADAVVPGSTSNAPVFLVEEVYDEDGDGTLDAVIGRFIETAYGGKPS